MSALFNTPQDIRNVRDNLPANEDLDSLQALKNVCLVTIKLCENAMQGQAFLYGDDVQSDFVYNMFSLSQDLLRRVNARIAVVESVMAEAAPMEQQPLMR